MSIWVKLSFLTTEVIPVLQDEVVSTDDTEIPNTARLRNNRPFFCHIVSISQVADYLYLCRSSHRREPFSRQTAICL